MRNPFRRELVEQTAHAVCAECGLTGHQRDMYHVPFSVHLHVEDQLCMAEFGIPGWFCSDWPGSRWECRNCSTVEPDHHMGGWKMTERTLNRIEELTEARNAKA